MRLRNLVKVIKHDVLKVEEPLEITKPIEDNKTLDGWTSYKIYYNLFNHPTPKITNLHSNYSVGKYVTNTFNAICSEAGVECTVTMDPNDYQLLYYFRNVGDRLVKIEWNNEVRFIEPGESVTLKANTILIDSPSALPNITPLNNGV
jgi:hypothetical protein